MDTHKQLALNSTRGWLADARSVEDRPPLLQAGVVALLAVAVALLVTLALRPLAERTTFILFVPAIMLSAWHGGVIGGIVAAITSMVVSAVWLLPRDAWLDEIVWFLVACVVALFTGAFTARVRRTERTQRQAAAEAERARQRLSDLVASVPGVVWEAWGQPDASEQRIDFVSNYVERMLGYSVEEWVRTPNFWLSVVHPDDRETAAQTAAEAFASGMPHSQQFRWLTKDGRTVWVEAHAIVVRDPSGRPVGMRGVVLDITARKQAEEALRRSEARFREMADTAPAMLWITDPSGSCTFLSRGWYEFTGQTAELGLGFGWIDAVHPDDRLRIKETFLAAIERHEAFAFDYRLRTASGECRWAIDTGRPRFAEDGSFLGHIGSVIDITERKLAEQEREQLLAREQQARAIAESASRLKDDFLAVLSHELRTPLNSILGWARLLRENRLPPERLAHALATIERNARVQAQLTEDLLDLSTIVSGKLRLNLAPADLSATVSAAIDAVRPAADGKGVTFEAHVAGATRPAMVDADRIQQVVWNLLSNAVKFTPSGGRVRVDLEQTDQSAEIRVADTGQGISADFLPHVFDRFRQGDSSASRRHGGLGLGLAIVRELVEAHGGAVRADSRGEGQGTTFKVVLPLRTDQASRPPRGQWSTASRDVSIADRAPKQSLSGVVVLVADDDSDTRELLTLTLERCGASVTAVGSVAEALAALSKRQHNILVSDIGMPDEDGYSLIRRLRADTRGRAAKIPAVAVTAYASLRDRQMAIAAGYDWHLSKPVDADALAQTIATLVGRTSEPV